VSAPLRLGGRRPAAPTPPPPGLYVNCDATSLPFKDATFDAILCSHTLYHIPGDQQEACVREFLRVLKPGCRCVIYYNVGEHSLIGKTLRPLVWLKRWTARFRRHPRIYSYHHPRQWFERFGRVDFHVYRLLPNQVVKYAFPDAPVLNAVGRTFVRGMHRLEQADRMLRGAQYLTIVLTRAP
jgi:SAM-dependent methyltransferase